MKPSHQPIFGTVWVSYSGGIGSAISAILAHENGLKYEMLFADTLIEDEDLYRFNADLERALGRRIIALKDGRNPWEVFKDEKNDRRCYYCAVL